MHTLLTTILKRYKLFPTNILALGNEELDSLTAWGSDHQMWGIVSSRDLVSQYKDTHPTAKLYAQKFESYRITGMMQLTYALHQQINQLDIKNRAKLFETIVKHTSPYGLMVIDVRLPAYYESQSKLSQTPQMSDDLISISTRQHKKGSYILSQMKLQVLTDDPDLYRKTHITTQYYTMTLPEIKKLIGQYRETVTVLDIKGRKLTKTTDHILLICQKGGPDWKVKK